MNPYFLGTAAALALFAGVQTWRIGELKDDIADQKAEIAKFNGYQTRAEADAQRQDDLCADRVRDARQSARAIERVIERPIHVDPEGCAVRELLSADELRGAIQPRAARDSAPAEPVR